MVSVAPANLTFFGSQDQKPLEISLYAALATRRGDCPGGFFPDVVVASHSIQTRQLTCSKPTFSKITR